MLFVPTFVADSVPLLVINDVLKFCNVGLLAWPSYTNVVVPKVGFTSFFGTTCHSKLRSSAPKLSDHK